MVPCYRWLAHSKSSYCQDKFLRHGAGLFPGSRSAPAPRPAPASARGLWDGNTMPWARLRVRIWQLRDQEAYIYG